jgi:anti-sigma regulatory factor (Ser/Thr protein kinase)
VASDDTAQDDGTRAPHHAGARRLRLRHPASLAEMRPIRRRVERWARQNDLPAQAVVDLQLALGEAVSNGMEHAYLSGAGGAATVEVELELRPADDVPVVAARVVDHGRWRPVPASPGYRGRGLALIERLSRDLQVSRTGDGTQVCFAIPLPG